MYLWVNPQALGEGGERRGSVPGRPGAGGWGLCAREESGLLAGGSGPVAPPDLLLRQVLPGALALALSGRCDADILRPLLAFPEDPTSARAARELCGLPGPRAYALVVSLTQNLDLRRLIYKVRG